MEEESEVLDWGNEDDEVQTSESHRSAMQQNGQDDVEDAVSLGGDEDDEIYPYKAPQADDPSKFQPSTPRATQTTPLPPSSRREGQRENSGTSQLPSSQQSDASQLRRSQSLGQLTHALPPKPAVAPPPFIPSTSTQTSTIASAMVTRERRPNGHPKNLSASRDRGDALPPDWEERLPRNGGREPYYYNIKTHKSTWARPTTADSGPSSPGKERRQDVRGNIDPSPRHVHVDVDSRTLRNEHIRVSPRTASRFDDRPYRHDAAVISDGASIATSRLDSHARPAGLPPRPPSPRATDRRHDTRSTTPPPVRRDTRPSDVVTRSRRDVTPPLDRGQIPRERRSSVHDRDWDRSRSAVLDSHTRGYPSEPRGRRLREEPPLEEMRPDQDTRDVYNSWSAPRPRSPPPHAREQTPPRRYPEPDAFDRERVRVRTDHPISPPLGRTRGADPYSSSDTIPQRRARDYETEYETEVKRRRVEEDPYRRRSTPDRRPTTSPMIERDVHQSSVAEPPNSKRRLPLPPQSDRFREVAKARPESPLPAPSAAPRSLEPYQNTRASVSYPDAPSAPRSHHIPPLSREQDYDRRGDTRARYEDPPTRHSQRGRDAMDVDYPPPQVSRAAARDELPPSRPRGVDRPSLDLQTSSLPKGPRAMSRSNGSLSQTTPSPSPVLPSHPIRMPEPIGRVARGPPPHLQSDVGPPPRGPAPPSAPRSYDYPEDNRRGRSRDFPETRHQEPPPPRSSRRDEAVSVSVSGSSALPKLSGTNSTPMGARRSYTPNPVEQPLRLPPAMPERTPTQHSPESYRATPRAAYSETPYNERRASYDERSRVPASGRGNLLPSPSSPQFSMPPPNALPPRPRDDHVAPSPRSGRQPRDGLDIPATPPTDAPRVWLTREESQSLSRGSNAPPGRGYRVHDNGREDVAPRYDHHHDRQAPLPRGKVYDDIPPRRNRVAEPASPPRTRSSNSSEDVRMYDRPQSMDGRSSHESRIAHYDSQADVRRPVARGRVNHDTHFDDKSPAARQSWSTSRGTRDDRDVSRDRAAESATEQRFPLHSERAHVEPQLPPPRDSYDRRTSTSFSGRDRAVEVATYSSSTAGGNGVGLQRSSSRQHATLLDRLTLDEPQTVAPPVQQSLRERVEPAPAAVKRTLPGVLPGVSGLPPRPSAETTYVAERDAFDAGRGRGKKRKSKP
ncbi:hypothetical protein PsYK624_098550 [Phanerochaete sordida]|uniref:WW domain-containing protein n=1 Tax=Phanerochaete sordida TaxID=48140 RepID=A0A9P3GF50_9APHY|nr:hypothetical protein PsYK624_098550 [Phanerochaete sordida]